jgi:ABC-2 type transport system permease protein
MDRLAPPLAVFRARFLPLLQYRGAALAGFATQCWWGLIRITVIAAFYAGGRSAPVTLDQAIAYVWLGQAFFAMLPLTADPEVGAMMRTGSVCYERLRPVDLYAAWYARALAWRAAPPLLRAVPMLIIAAVLLPALGLGVYALRPPPTVAAALIFPVSLLLALLLSAALSTLIDISVIVMLSARGITAFSIPLLMLLSGMIVPLPLFPDWLQPLLFAQPFAGLVDIPYRIYFGDLVAGTAALGLVQQTVWIALIVHAGRLLMRRAMDRIEIQGG